MKIKLITVGTLKEKYLKDAYNEYAKRLSKYVSLTLIELKEENDIKHDAKKIECERVLKTIKSNDYVVALTLNKKEYTSEDLSIWLDKTFQKANSEIVFIIGGSLGLNEEVIKRANDTITLSKLTFTHQMTRIILLEQIYRCFKILHNERYHK